MSNHDIPHGVLSTMFVDTKQLLKEFNKMEVKLLMSSKSIIIAARNSLNQIDLHNVFIEMEELQSICQEFQYDKVVFKKTAVEREYISRFSEDSMKSWLCQFVILKGLLDRIDCTTASAHIPVEEKMIFWSVHWKVMVCMQEDAKKNRKNFLSGMTYRCI